MKCWENKLTNEVSKVVGSAEAKYGFIYIPKDFQPKKLPTEIILVYEEEKRAKMDKKGRLWFGKDVANKLGVSRGAVVNLKWVSEGKLRIAVKRPMRLDMPNHNTIRDMIMEIGMLKGVISVTEYPIDNMRIDVAWKKVKKGNPHVVFEIQISGNFYEALVKLKHAWDLWNSTPILVTTEKYKEKAERLVDVSFHEIKQVIRIVDWRLIRKLYDALKYAKEIESKIRLH